MIQFLSFLRTRIANSSERSQEAIKNIGLSIVARSISILCSLLIVPVTIDYVNPSQYGIWLTLSSIIGWISFFDLGMGNGFRNKYAESKANGDLILARKYFSTTFFSISTIFCVLLIMIQIANLNIKWPLILNLSSSYENELRIVFAVFSFSFCTSMVFRLTGTLLTADQKPGISALIEVGGQVISLLGIVAVANWTEGSLTNLAIVYSFLPLVVWGASTLILFKFTKFKNVAPSLAFFDKNLVKDILGLGFQFFLIYLCMIMVFQVVNIVISRELGPVSVSEYNVAYKYFSVSHMGLMIILTPYWTAFTDAFHKQDVIWMKQTKKRLEQMWILFNLFILLLLVFSDTVFKLWIGKSLSISFILSFVLSLYFMFNNLAAIYLNIINGIGCICIQTVVYTIMAILSYPLMLLGSHLYGLIGVACIPGLTIFILAIISKIQVEKILSGQANGIWLK